MASKRCIPTRFFKDPDIINLRKDTQLILIGLVLNADDEGREVAHAKVLGQEMDYPPEQIEAALQELVANDLIMLYQVGRHRYYSLTQQWQSLGSKMTPSRFPAPPQNTTVVPTEIPGNPGVPREILESVGVSGGNPAQVKEVNRSKGKEGEEKPSPSDPIPSNVVPFPTSTSDNGTTDSEAEEQATTQAAAILKLPLTPALGRIVHEFMHDPTISILGEADAAREYIDSPDRNRQGKAMTPAFFRRWLKREQVDIQQRQRRTDQATGTTDNPATARSPAGHSLMDLEARYQSARAQGGKET